MLFFRLQGVDMVSSTSLVIIGSFHDGRHLSFELTVQQTTQLLKSLRSRAWPRKLSRFTSVLVLCKLLRNALIVRVQHKFE